MISYRIAIQAQSDLDGIREYTAQRNPSAASRLIAGLHKRFALIASHPLLGEECEYIRPRLRRFVVSNYVVYYRVGDDVVDVIRVLHAARDVDSLM